MFEYQIKGKDLAAKLGLSVTSVSILKNSQELPEIGSKRLCQIANALTELTGVTINPLQLIEYKHN